MSVVINTNIAANLAANNLSDANSMLQQSLARLSSGKRIVNPSDDAGGLAVSMSLTAAIGRADAANTNVANAVSFLQTQDGALGTSGAILNRISEFKTLSSDVIKSTTDVAAYNKEFSALSSQLPARRARSSTAWHCSRRAQRPPPSRSGRRKTARSRSTSTRAR